MGGFGAHEYMAPCAAGENDVALSSGGYAANVEVASATPQPVDGLPEALPQPERIDTPKAATVDQVAGQLGVPAGAVVKAFPVLVEDRGPVLVVIRGDHRLNEIKLQNALGAAVRAAEPEEVGSAFGSVPGFIGPVGARVEVIADQALEGLHGLVAGGNEPDLHLRGVEPGRDFEATWADVRSVEAGDTAPDGAPITIEPAIEIANIFKLGLRYSEPLGARYSTSRARSSSSGWVPTASGGAGRGCRRGTARRRARHRLAARSRALRRRAGDARKGGRGGADGRGPPRPGAARDRSRGALRPPHVERGEKFADAELLGCPLRLTIGKRSVESRGDEPALEYVTDRLLNGEPLDPAAAPAPVAGPVDADAVVEG